MRTCSLLFLIVLCSLFSCNQSNDSSKKSSDLSLQPNNLIHETSPYLLQHAYNPVDWNAWNSESLERAQKENKLIVISVGYSACHWCHVMEEESFENDSVAKLMNDHFINIKVDREERPDIDQIYMNAVQLMTGSGGWPLNCITLPDGRPVFGGTYFTKQQWMKILKDMSNLYQNDPEKVIAYAEKLTEGIHKSELITVNKNNVSFEPQHLGKLVNHWISNLDFTNGGRKGSQKFPMPSNLNFLLRYSFQYDNNDLLNYVTTTLTKMAYGGLYDQIGGGFSRYTVDEKWHIPHFEKMLYDNAQLVSLYSNAYTHTKSELYKTTVTETLEFIERELTNEDGAFYSSIDADSKNQNGDLEEGVFYSWSVDELQQSLGTDFDLFKSYYNINNLGRWENDQYVLIKTKSDEDFAEAHQISPEELKTKVSNWKSVLFKARELRERPRTDDKILTSWNALMLKGYVDAYRAFGNPLYLERAIKNANFIKNNQLKKDGELYHNFKNGKSSVSGFSENYALTIEAFIALYEVSLDEDWLHTANTLMDYAITHFTEQENGLFYFTSDSATNLITRKMEVDDNVIPASNSVLAKNLFKLSHYFSNDAYKDRAVQMLNNIIVDVELAPSGYSNWLDLYLNYSNPFYEVAISGSQAKQKIQTLTKSYLPQILIAGSTTDSTMPLLQNRYQTDETYIYICVNSVCKLPQTDIDEAFKNLPK